MKTSERIVFATGNTEADKDFLRTAFRETKVPVKLVFSPNEDKLLKDLEICYSEKRFPKMILLSCNLEEAPGFKTLKKIKSHALFKKIPTVVFSSQNSQKCIRKAYDFGANNFIVKPTTLEDFEYFVKAIRNSS